MSQPVIFISYSHRDEAEKELLLTQLGVLRGASGIDLWSDDRIGAGSNWQQEIRAAIDRAKVAVLLVSANFLNSEFIMGTEVPALLKRRQSEGLIIFPVIAKACAWKRVRWLAEIQVRPKNGHPVWGQGGGHADEELALIAEEIGAIVESVPPEVVGTGAVPDVELLDSHRQTLTHLNAQRAHYKPEAVPFSLTNAIREQEAAIAQLMDRPAPGETESRARPERNHLPVKGYDHFTGRTAELEKVLAALDEPDRYRLVAVYGMGGIGKTALARETVELSLQRGQFHQAVWVSAKPEKLAGVGVERLPDSDLTFDSLLDDIARQCHLPPPDQRSLTNKVHQIQGLLAARPVLIVLDNLETVPEYETLVSQVGDLLRGQSKLLLTSRHAVKHSHVYAIPLDGLAEAESLRFQQEESRSGGVDVLAEAPNEALIKIHRVTGGAPLAMKLVVGQLRRQPLEAVLDSLKAASAHGQHYEFYRFVFKYSWDLLSPEAKRILVSMATFDPTSGGTVHMMLQVSRVAEAAFYPALDDLVTMSLVDYGGAFGQPRYNLHPLTHTFVMSDIVKMWG
jgi:hypothetical protein